MMNYLIPALAATSAMQYNEQLNNADKPKGKYTAREVLAKFYDIHDKDLNEKCDKVNPDKEARWKEIRQTMIELRDAKADQRKHPEKYEKLSEEDKFKPQTKIIKTALPCADKDKVAAKLKFHKDQKWKKKDD